VAPRQELLIVPSVTTLDRLIAEAVCEQADRLDGSCDAIGEETAWTK
jgi:hypothetical protein